MYMKYGKNLNYYMVKILTHILKRKRLHLMPLNNFLFWHLHKTNTPAFITELERLCNYKSKRQNLRGKC